MILAWLVAQLATVRLAEEGATGMRFVPLGDISEIEAEPELRDRLRGIFLGAAPAEGAERTITADEVRAHLARLGLDGVRVEGDGVVVRCAATGASDARAALDAALAEAVLTLRGEPLTGTRARIAWTDAPGLAAGDRIAELGPVACDARGTGRYRFRLSRPDGEGAWYEAEVRLLHQVAIARARTALNRGRTLTSEDVVRDTVEAAPGEGYIPYDEVVGGRVLDAVPAGGALTQWNARRRPVLRRGTTVRAQGPGYETNAVADEDGAVGDLIRIQFPATNRPAVARVVSPTRVEVMP